MNSMNGNPYVGPRTFQQAEGKKFFGRDQEARDLLNLIISDRMVLFYAQSGAGKSSLINTRILPGLESKKFEVLPVGRVGGDLPPGCAAENVYVFNLMRSLIEHGGEDAFAGLDLATFLARLNKDEQGYFYDPRPVEAVVVNDAPASPASSASPEGDSGEIWPRALIIDQFEELLSTHPEAWEKREDFFAQLADAARADPYLWVVLVMREDYAASLAPYTHRLPGGLRARYYMQQMGRDAALDAVKKPVEKEAPFAPGVAEKLVDDLRKTRVQNPLGSGVEMLPGPYVEPVQLQVVCFRLWQNLRPGHRQITEKDLNEIGDVDQALATYYAERVRVVAEETGVPERQIRDWFGRQLITGPGVRGQVLMGDTTSGGMENEVVSKLRNSHLVRFENRGGATWIELTHDRLVEPIRGDNAAWTERNLSMLQRAAELWAQQEKPDGLLLGAESLVEAQKWADEHGVTPLEQDFLDACWGLQNREKLERENAEQAIKLEAANKVAEVQSLRAEERDRAAKKLSQRAVILGVLAMIAILLAGLSYFSTLQAQKSKATAEAQQLIAEQYSVAIAANSTEDAVRRQTMVVQTEEYAAQIAQMTGTAGVEFSRANLKATNDEQIKQVFMQLVATQTMQARLYEVTIDSLLSTIQVPPTSTPTLTPAPSPTLIPTNTPQGLATSAPVRTGPPYVYENVTIDNVLVNGKKAPLEEYLVNPDTLLMLYTYRGKPGETITVKMDYVIVMQEFCPSCIDEIQVGLSHTDPLGCIYIGIPEKRGTRGNGEIAVTIPDGPGPYFLAFDRTLDYSCPVQWGSGSPDIKKDRYFLKIEVERALVRPSVFLTLVPATRP